MINKEEINWAKQYLKETIIDWKNELKGKDYFEYITFPNNLKTIEIVSQYVSELEEDNKRLEEINEEHQKLNGELQKKLIEYEKQLDLDYVEENYVKKSVFLNLLKENGKLKDRLIIAEEICKGKSIQELGMSDLYYKED